jgi:hypothetical protein
MRTDVEAEIEALAGWLALRITRAWPLPVSGLRTTRSQLLRYRCRIASLT